MSSNRTISSIGAIVFALLALASLYRLMVGLPITINGHQIGQTTSFFAFAIFAALCLAMLKSAFSNR